MASQPSLGDLRLSSGVNASRNLAGVIDGQPGTRTLDGAYVPATTPGVVAVDAEVEAVLVDELTDQLHLLNGSAALLWECFDGESTVADIAFDLADELGVPYEQILSDTLNVVEGLASQGVVYDGRNAAPERHVHGPDCAHGGSALVDQSLDVPRVRRILEEPPNA